jgi:hypothetical protein
VASQLQHSLFAAARAQDSDDEKDVSRRGRRKQSRLKIGQLVTARVVDRITDGRAAYARLTSVGADGTFVLRLHQSELPEKYSLELCPLDTFLAEHTGKLVTAKVMWSRRKDIKIKTADGETMLVLRYGKAQLTRGLLLQQHRKT